MGRAAARNSLRWGMVEQQVARQVEFGLFRDTTVIPGAIALHGTVGGQLYYYIIDPRAGLIGVDRQVASGLLDEGRCTRILEGWIATVASAFPGMRTLSGTQDPACGLSHTVRRGTKTDIRTWQSPPPSVDATLWTEAMSRCRVIRRRTRQEVVERASHQTICRRPIQIWFSLESQVFRALGYESRLSWCTQSRRPYAQTESGLVCAEASGA